MVKYLFFEHLLPLFVSSNLPLSCNHLKSILSLRFLLLQIGIVIVSVIVETDV